jgi:hypothetical protein
MLTKGTARPAARKGSGSKAKKTVAVAVASRKSEPIIQMVERRSSRNLLEMPKKVGELPIPTATFVF